MISAQIAHAQEAYIEEAKQFLQHTEHPRFHTPYATLTYQPMKELIQYLKAKQFKVFIVSGGGTGFIQSLSNELYGIPREHVIGNTVNLSYREDAHGLALIRTKEIVSPYNDREGKAINILLRLGRKPILAVGNASSDLPMLKLTQSNPLPHLNILLIHDDAAREYDYQDNAQDIIKAAKQQQWTTISMRKDFKQVF